MTPKFKPGPAKTRDGWDAVIYEVTDYWIYGRIGDESARWSSQGEWGGCLDHCSEDLLPNVEPFRFEAKVEWASHGYVHPFTIPRGGRPFDTLIGKRGTLVFTEDME